MNNQLFEPISFFSKENTKRLKRAHEIQPNKYPSHKVVVIPNDQFDPIIKTKPRQKLIESIGYKHPKKANDNGPT